jgi:GTP-binding protein LepA
MDGAMIEEVKDQIIDLIGCKPDDILLASGRTGIGIEGILDAIVNRIPSPKGDPTAPLQALVFDSVFNSFRGIIVYYRILNGSINKGDKIKFVSTDIEYGADEVGILKLTMQEQKSVQCRISHYRYKKCERSKGRRYHHQCS